MYDLSSVLRQSVLAAMRSRFCLVSRQVAAIAGESTTSTAPQSKVCKDITFLAYREGEMLSDGTAIRDGGNRGVGIVLFY